MGSQLNFSENELANERMEKADKLLLQWYETVFQIPLPPSGDPSLLYRMIGQGYFLTENITTIDGWEYIYQPHKSGDPKISVDWNAIDNTIVKALADTTGKDTGQGYGTGVVRPFDGKYDGQKCIYKLALVAVSFSFQNGEYNIFQPVALFGYRVYFFLTDPPFRYGDHVPRPIHDEPYTDKIPNDVSVIGRKIMTVEELDRYNP
ncbi:hypothetical protein Clacol_000947 [Clathrus columnatus]|uniref:Uncharacterized protein n=1 Tax=Clathrus columnatus TaxID=1419009 RepID=A0AAV4ZXD9_9AGAM|nr:hypothetical protein Clacol_000947 [Clathrus columnatus]